MSTRIREFRKLRGLTLRELAEKIGTTPQTVQRLETATMTVSVEWLEKIAGALGVEPVELIGGGRGREIPFIGRIMKNGHVHPRVSREPDTLHIHVPADDPVAAQIDARIGGFDAGTILIANRLREADYANAHGTDCLVELRNGLVLFRRLVRGKDQSWTLVPHESGVDIYYDQTPAWIARLVMTLRYF